MAATTTTASRFLRHTNQWSTALSRASQRCFASAAVEETEAAAPTRSGIEVSKLHNGIIVASEEDGSPFSTVSVSVAAGSRYEGPGNAGVSHVLRHMAYQGTQDRTAFAMTRIAEANGLELSATNDRETLSYNSRFLRDNLGEVLENLGDAVTRQSMNPWEVQLCQARVVEDLANNYGIEEATLDMLHNRAFRDTLGRSPYAADYKVGCISGDVLADYVASRYHGGAISIFASGVNHEQLLELVDANFGHVGASSPETAQAATYHGSQHDRMSCGSPDTHIAIGFSSRPLGSPEGLAASVLANVLGSGSAVKWSPRDTSKVAAAVGAASADAQSKSINMEYSDNGLLSVYIKTPADAAGNVAKGAADAITSTLGGDITDAEVTAAKNAVARSLLDMSKADRGAFVNKQLLVTDEPDSPEVAAERVMAVSTADVKALGKNILKAGAVTSITGELGYAPYADEIGL